MVYNASKFVCFTGMASRWSRYRADLNKIERDIEYYRQRGEHRVADCLETRKERLVVTLRYTKRLGPSSSNVHETDVTSNDSADEEGDNYVGDDNNVGDENAEGGGEEQEEEDDDALLDVPEDFPENPFLELDSAGETGEAEDDDDETPLFEEGHHKTLIGTDDFAHFRTDVTFREIIGALIILKTCHKMPWSLFLSVVHFIQALLVAECSMLPNTHVQLKKFFSDLVGIETKRVVYCTVCWTIAEILPDMHDRPSATKFCRKCGHDVATDAKERKGNFIWLPTLPQICSFIRRGKLYKVVRDFSQKLSQFF
jgi:hypothetical protein